MIKKTLFVLSVILCFILLLSSCQKNRVSTYVKLDLIPGPKEIKGEKNSEGEYKALEYMPTISNSEFKDAKDSFCTYAKNIYNVEFTDAKDAEIKLIKDKKIGTGAYKIKADNKSVRLYASEDTGINYALATLLQIMQKSGNGIYIPKVNISDHADSEYRGMMVDLARNWHEFDNLLNYVDMCYYYKISVLHLHFTDSQSYTLPSDKYPELPTEGRHYTKEQIGKLTEYAKNRGIQLMPEIDVPGHCDSFQTSYPEVFGTGGIIHQHEDSMKAMAEIFDELCGMFPDSTYIHIGGDEAAINKWVTCRKCKDYVSTLGIDTSIKDKVLLSEQMYANFVMHLSNVVFKNNRTPIVWEGFSKDVNDLVSKDVIVMSWENYYQPTFDLLEAGFKIINSSWVPLYIVTPDVHWTQEQVFNWSIYSWKPVHGGSPYPKGFTIEPNEKVLGGQILAWGDKIITQYKGRIPEGVKQEMKLLLERLPALSENTWNNEKKMTYDKFKATSEKTNSDIGRILNIH